MRQFCRQVPVKRRRSSCLTSSSIVFSPLLPRVSISTSSAATIFCKSYLGAMATTLAAAARRIGSLSRTSSPASSFRSANLTQRRGLAGAADHHGPPKVNCWSEPMNPRQWKEEHFVIVSLSGWGLLFYGGYKAFSGGKKEEKLVEASH